MKKYLVLIILFVLPLVAYLFFASGINNFAKLPVLTESIEELELITDKDFNNKISILLFLAYHFLGIFSKNLAEDSSINPILASWLSTLIMLPFSIYLTYRATNDKSVFNFGEYIISFYKKIEKYVKG